MTILQALNVSDRSVSSREAEIFLQEILQVERSWLHAHSEQELTAPQEKQFTEYMRLREENQPVAYIIGHREFYGRKFKCDSRVLIPRPETERLIDKALDWLPGYFQEHTKASNKPCPVRILELGTGSGNIAVTLGAELANRQIPSQMVVTEISEGALELAKENWQSLKDDSAWSSLHFVQADLFDHEMIKSRAPYHLIIANLPYVPDDWKFDPIAQPEVVFQEPDIALFGGNDGMDIYRRFFAEAASYLSEDGRILVEYGETETEAMKALAAEAFPGRTITVYQDYAGLDRSLEIV